MHSMFLAFEICMVLEEDNDDAAEDGLRVAFRMERWKWTLKCNYSKVMHEKQVLL